MKSMYNLILQDGSLSAIYTVLLASSLYFLENGKVAEGIVAGIMGLMLAFLKEFVKHSRKACKTVASAPDSGSAQMTKGIDSMSAKKVK